MGRTRNIKPGFLTNEELPECGVYAHLLFAGLWTIADKEGRLEDRPKRIKTQCLPYYDVDVNELLQGLHDRGFISRYEVNGLKYIQVVNWHKHQNPHHKEAESEIPEPFTNHDSSMAEARAELEATMPQAPLEECKLEGSKECEVTGSEDAKKRAGARRHPFTSADVKLPEAFDRIDVRSALQDWLDYKADRREPYGSPAYLGSLVKSYSRDGPDAFVDAVHHSIGSNYKGVFRRDEKQHGRQQPKASGARSGYDPNRAGGDI